MKRREDGDAIVTVRGVRYTGGPGQSSIGLAQTMAASSLATRLAHEAAARGLEHMRTGILIV